MKLRLRFHDDGIFLHLIMNQIQDLQFLFIKIMNHLNSNHELNRISRTTLIDERIL